MAVVGSNILNTIDVADRLPLMRRRDDAIHFGRGVGFHAVFVPSNLGGRLRIGFGGYKYEHEKKRLGLENKKLGVVDPHGNTHTRDESGEVRIDIVTRMRGHGVFQVAVYDEAMDYHLYALFEETGTARQADGSPLIPWNFWYFPFADSAKDRSAWGGTELQPIQKYERAFGETGVLAWEIQHHADPGKNQDDWAGHCHMAALASVMFINPKAAGVEFNDEKFLAEELKFLAAEFAGRFGRITDVYALPEKGGFRRGPLHEKKPSDDPEAFGRQLTTLLESVRKQVGVHGNALIMDLRDATGADYTEVWNHAVYRYVTRYWQPDVSDPTLVDGACTLFANADIYSGTTSSGLPATTKFEHGETVLEHGGDSTSCRNEFTLRFAPNGLHDTFAPENRWTSTKRQGVDTFAPRYAKRTEKPAKKVVEPHGNPRIDPNHVLALLQLRPEFL